MISPDRWQFSHIPLLARHALTVLMVALVTVLLRPLSSVLETQVVVLIYLLPVVASALFFGLAPAILASVAGFLAFNFFFLPPYNTLMVHKTLDLITLIMYLVVSGLMSQLIGRAREGEALAREREWEATRMYEFIAALAGLHDLRQVGGLIMEHARMILPQAGVAIEIDASAADSALSGALVLGDADRPEPPDARAPMQTPRAREGEIRLWLDGGRLRVEERRLIDAFASQGALAIERIRLSRAERRATILEESDRMKSSLLSSVSHELRTPLSAIKASVSSLRSGAVEADTEAGRELVAMIEDETDRLNQLVGNLLDMSRIEAGALSLRRAWNSIEEIAAGAAAKMRKQLAGRALVLNFAPDLPLVPVDYVLVDQVFTNLISNSIKYAPADSTITVRGERGKDGLHVTVVNEGPPVGEDDLRGIFEKFHRVTQADKVTGTGLGLSICKGIVEAHGGTIWARNGASAGCAGCFEIHFTLPLALDGALPGVPKESKNG